MKTKTHDPADTRTVILLFVAAKESHEIGLY